MANSLDRIEKNSDILIILKVHYFIVVNSILKIYLKKKHFALMKMAYDNKLYSVNSQQH